MSGNRRILVTGATGFIGSNIARKLLRDGYEIYATKRSSSSLDKCKDCFQQIRWINLDDKHWPGAVYDIHSSILIHAAWHGIKESERNNWDLQISNFQFSKVLFDIIVECGVEKIIALGSQAEYGVYDEPSIESMVTCPTDAYGAIKTLTSNYLKIICQSKSIPWYWLRVFSVFGPGENVNRLIPQVIMNLLKHQEIQLTEGKQKYDYLFIDDFLENISGIINSSRDFPGIYNICSGKPVEIKELLITLAEVIGVPTTLLKFGPLSYRKNQNMIITGNHRKFEEKFGQIKSRDLSKSLEETVKYYNQYFKEMNALS